MRSRETRASSLRHTTGQPGPPPLCTPHPSPKHTPPCLRVVSRLCQVGEGKKNGRKSDPHGGAIKPAGDWQSSWKPGQGSITAVTLQLLTSPASSLFPQQHQRLRGTPSKPAEKVSSLLATIVLSFTWYINISCNLFHHLHQKYLITFKDWKSSDVSTILSVFFQWVDNNPWTRSFLVYVPSDMRLLSHVAFLLLLGGIWCQNNRNAKIPKTPKKPSGSQRVESQTPPVVHQTTGSSRRSGGSGGSAEAAQEAAAGGRAAQQTNDMRLHFLKNTRVTCNDGTAAGWDALHVFLPLFLMEVFAG